MAAKASPPPKSIRSLNKITMTTTTFDTFRKILIVLIGLSIPTSTVLTNILCPLALLLLLAEGRYQQKWHLLRTHPITLPALLLFGVMLLGMIQTPVSLAEAGRMLDKYRELLYIPLFILLFQDASTRRLGRLAFLTAMGVTLLLSYLIVWTGWTFGKGGPENPVVFKNYITQGLFLSLAAYFLAVQWVHQPTRWRWLYSVGILLILYNIVYLTQGRTGYLILASLILLLMYQLYHTRGLWLGVLLVTFLSFFAYQTSDKVYERIEKVSTGLQDYEKGEETSVPMRISFIKNSVILVTQHPLLGAGTGSFSHQYEQLARPQGIKTTANPHNEYLMIAVQWGLLGTGLFVYLLYQLMRTSVRLTSPYDWMAQGLVITMTIGCLFNSFLLDSTEGHLFAYLVGLFWGELPLKEEVQRVQDTLRFKGTWQWSISPDRLGQLLTLIAAIVPVLWVYQTVITPTLSHKSLLLPNNQVIPSLLTTIQQRASPILVPFETTLQTSKGLHLSVFTGEEITLTTRIQVASPHIGKTAYIVILAAYQPPHASATETIWLQRRHSEWVPLDRELLRTEQYYSQLPESLEVSIYQGKLLLAGTVTVYVGYLLEDNSFIFNDNRIQLEIIKEGK